MTTADTLAILVAVISCIATALATLAAFRSAKSAASAQAALLASEEREVLRQVASLASDIERETRRAKFLAHAMNVIGRANAIFNGGLGGSRQKLAEKGIEDRLNEVELLGAAAIQLLAQQETISKLRIEDAHRIRLQRTVELARLRAINDELELDRACREAQLLQHREVALQRPPR